MRRWSSCLLPFLFACSSGGGGGGPLPDAGTGGGGGSGGTVGNEPLTLAVSDCRVGGEIGYTTPTSTATLDKGVVQVAKGTSVSLEAVPDPQSVFLGWTGDCSGSDVCALTVDAPKQVSAEFGPKVSSAKGWNFSTDTNNAGVGRLALGSNGEIALGISFQKTLDLGGGTVLETTGIAEALAVYEADGSLRWFELWANHEWEIAALRWVNGDLVAAGTRKKAWSTDGFELDGLGDDAMMARFAGATGTVLAAASATPNVPETVSLAAIAQNGNIAVFGDFGATANLGGSDLVADANQATNEWVASFDASFVHQWSTSWSGDNTFSRTEALDVDALGNVVVGGSVQAELAIPGATLTNTADSESPFLARFDSTGALVYAKLFEAASSSNQVNAVHLASNGDLVAGMIVSPSIDIGTGPLEPNTNTTGQSDMLLARFAPEGTPIWARRYATGGLEQGLRLALEGETITVEGELAVGSDPTDYGTGLVHGSGFDVLVGQFSASDGATQWVRRFGCSDWDRPSMVTAAGDQACFTGTFRGQVDYGGPAPFVGDAIVPAICVRP